MNGISRRRYLAFGSALIGAALAGCSGEQLDREESTRDGEPETKGKPSEEDDLRRRLTTLEAELEARENRIDELEETISTLEESGAESRFGEGIRSKALELGTQIRESVVFVQTSLDGNRSGHGTGFFVRDDLVVTNSHVIAGSESIHCWTFGGDQLGATVVGNVDSQNPDVAALRVPNATRPPLSMGSSEELSADDPLVQVGHPGSYGNWVITLGPFVRRQMVRTADGGTATVLLTDVAGSPGVSGSPILTLDGNVVGLTYAGTPKKYRQPDERPEPAPAKVYESVAPETYALHETIERVESQLRKW